jgi:hypothetical protein
VLKQKSKIQNRQEPPITDKMNEKASDEISLKELLEKGKEWYGYLLSQWKSIVVAGIIGSVIGLTYAIITKPIYDFIFALEGEKSGGGLGSALGLASSLV